MSASISRRLLLVSTVLAGAGGHGPAYAQEANWPAIKEMLFGERELAPGGDLMALEAPGRAHDAAVVPITIKAPASADPARRIKTLWLVIDENPAPVAGVFHLAEDAPDATIATRVRVNAYTPVHAVAETSEGRLFVVERFVKAAGGCSAPAMKDKEQALARLGQMRFKLMTSADPARIAAAQLLISHPNYSGMQIDQLSRNWIPPDYVKTVRVTRGGKPVLSVEGDIALSEDPAFTFSFKPDPAAGPIEVAVEDSQGRKFSQSFPATAAGT